MSTSFEKYKLENYLSEKENLSPFSSPLSENYICQSHS